MSLPIAGIDPHQDSFTVGIVDSHGIEICHETFPNSGSGYVDGIDFLTTHSVKQVGVECSAKWGAHVAIALVAGGFDAREIPASRSAAQRRSRRLVVCRGFGVLVESGSSSPDFGDDLVSGFLPHEWLRVEVPV